MILLTMRMTIWEERQTELLQTYHTVLPLIRAYKGCLSCRLSVDTEDPTRFYLYQEWESREHLQHHLQTDIYKVLIGAAQNLSGEVPFTVCISQDVQLTSLPSHRSA